MYKLKYELRKWQEEAFKAWTPSMKGIIRVVTGGGKTIFAELCAAKFLETRPDGLVVIIVPTITLQDQWRSSLIAELGAKDTDILTPTGSPGATLRKFNILVINSARKGLGKAVDESRVMLIVDECHRAGSEENSKSLRNIPACAHLGLSATPEREQDDGFLEYMQPVLGEVIYSYDYNQALKDGVICNYELVNVKVPMTKEESDLYDLHTKKIARIAAKIKAGTLEKEAIKLALIARARVGVKVKARLGVSGFLAKKHTSERTIIFHESISGCVTLEEVLRKSGVNCTIYHSKLSEEIRKSNLHEFRLGTFNTLITCRALDEGMNAPETTIAIIASSTTSRRQRIQRLGRVLRPHKNKTQATIYSLYCTSSEEKNLRAEATELEGKVKVTWKETKTK
jgi:superfamily II DNA or RNA helicase